MKKYIVKQEDEFDCGACSLLSIIKYYDGYVPLEVIKIDTLTNEMGTNLYNIKTASIKYGFDASGIKTNDLKNIILPCIAQINISGYYHFVVLYEVGDNITYMDPATGIKKLTILEFNEIYTGNILELIPAGKIIKYEKTNHFKMVLIDLYKEHIKVIITLLIISIVIVVLSLITGFNPVLLKSKKIIPIVILISFSKIIIAYIKNNTVSHLNKKINISLLNNYLTQIFNLPLKYLQLKKTGDFLNRINDLENIKNIFSKTLLEVIINSLLLILSLVILFIIEFKLTFILLIITLIYTLILYLFNKRIYKNIILSIESDNLLTDQIVEYLNKVITIKTNKINYFQNQLKKFINNSNEERYNLDKLINIFTLISSSLEELMIMIILIYYYHYNLNISFALLYLTIFGYYLESNKYYINLLPVVLYFKDVMHRIKSIYDIKKEDNKIKYSKNIYLNNISYSYNNINPVLYNFTTKINFGSKVLIKGTNGTGKSTIFDILYGNITDYNGVVVRNKKINYVHQKSELITGTILDNIILDEQYDKEKLFNIIDILLLDDFINNKLKGLDFNITNISNLSGGEKQKILLARGLYKNFDILLLDESLNEIASSDRTIILNNIFNKYKSKTIIYISHYHDKANFNQIIKLTARKD